MSSSTEHATAALGRTGSAGVSNTLAPSASSADLAALESQVDELIGICQRLRDENVALKNQQHNLLAERAQLIERSELARSRVEAMIARLKAMESGA